jgi:hypothetical protein
VLIDFQGNPAFTMMIFPIRQIFAAIVMPNK